MNSESIEKQIINWNIHTFQNLASVVNLIHRAEKKEIPVSYDYKVRDFYFHPSTDLFGFKSRTTFIQHASSIIKNFFSFNQLGYLQSLSFEHHMQKHKFWNKIYRSFIKSKDDYEIKSQVQSIVWTYRLIPFMIFIFGATVIMAASGISKMTRKKQAVGLVAAVLIADVFVRTKKSSQIFYLIPPIQNQELENERLQILNKGLVLDGKINQIEYKPQFEADKTPDYEQKKLLLEAAGFTVVDSVSYEYL